MRNKLILILVTVVLTLIGQFELQQILQKQVKPVLSRNILRTDLSGLPPDILKQLPLIPLNYTLKHSVGLSALNVTVLIRSDVPLSSGNIKFSPDSEAAQVTLADPDTIRINAPTIRPGGLLNFQLIAPATSRITFSELSENANIIGEKELQDQAQKSISRTQMAIVVLGVAVWLALVIMVGYLLWQIGKWWEKLENGNAMPELKHRLIVAIIVLFIYDTVVTSLGPLGGFLPIPRIFFSDFASAFLLYLLVTRYKLVEAWLVSKTGKSEPDKHGE
jgi:hypothetical protein